MLGEICMRPVVTIERTATPHVVGIVALDDILIILLLGTEMGHVAAALSRSLGRRVMA